MGLIQGLVSRPGRIEKPTATEPIHCSRDWMTPYYDCVVALHYSAIGFLLSKNVLSLMLKLLPSNDKDWMPIKNLRRLISMKQLERLYQGGL